jgi:DNA ligase D-like protein (predicted 3'-phosphoesterase)
MGNCTPGGQAVPDSGDDKLKRYREKRNFEKTPEPEGSSGIAGAKSGGPVFIIQKHDAQKLHYDFRLEVDGVLKSWAVPKGPSLDPGDKRLAVATEDHALDYGDFEGVIPEGEYGAGPVLIWDRGTYENVNEKDDGLRSMTDSLKDGHVLVRLNGEKISGGYALQRIDDDEDQWLLIKIDDDEADRRRNPTSTQPDSVASGRSIEEIAGEDGEA